MSDAPAEEVSDELRQAMAEFQRWQDKQREMFKEAVETAEPSPDDLRRTMAVNMTTKPRVNYATLTLIWMQRSPASWAGYSPETCMQVAEMMGIGEIV